MWGLLLVVDMVTVHENKVQLVTNWSEELLRKFCSGKVVELEQNGVNRIGLRNQMNSIINC